MSVSTTGDTAAASARPPAAGAPAGPPLRRLQIRFSGSGAEYFRIWIVNLLLTIVTLSLYYPWAKVRKLRYFYGNTVVDGQPLAFHGHPLKVLRGYLLVGALLAAYGIAGRRSPGAGFFAFLIVAALWPGLMKSTLQFRLANTSWRGLRMRFVGSLGGAYRAVLPAYVPAVLFFGAAALAPPGRRAPGAAEAMSGVAMLALVAVMPWVLWKVRKYQHDHYVYGPLQTELRARARAFYALAFKTIGVALLGGIAASLIGVAIGGAVYARLGGMGRVAGVLAGLLVGFLGIVAINLAVRPYFASRLQNLVWSRTGNSFMHFTSALTFRALFGLTLKNLVLVVLTLGLYWPFAAVAMARLKLDAMGVVTRVDPEALASRARATEGDAAGDAAGDLFGFDIGF
ncbi:MAG TPA: YjgN family protein [Caldimonas sp.]|nr:YjgN family protein [Caldimonas sp.]